MALDQDFATAVTRTAVPSIVGWAISLPVAAPIEHALGVDSGHATRALTAAITAAIAIVYYVVVHFLEQKVPAAGVLLGIPKKPVYEVPGFTGSILEGTVVGTGPGTSFPDEQEIATVGAHAAETIARLAGTDQTAP